MIQCRCVICSVTSHCYYFTFLLEQLYQTLLIHRTCTAHHLQIDHSFQSFFIAQGSKLHSGNAVPFRIFRCPQPDLSCDFSCCSRSISRYNLHTDTSRLAFLHRIRHIRTNRVTDRKNSHECQSAFLHQFRTIRTAIFRNYLISHSQCTHSLILVSQKLFIILLNPAFFQVTFPHHNLRSPLHIKHTCVQDRRVDQRSHILPFCRESKLIYRFRLISQ